MTDIRLTVTREFYGKETSLVMLILSNVETYIDGQTLVGQLPFHIKFNRIGNVQQAGQLDRVALFDVLRSVDSRLANELCDGCFELGNNKLPIRRQG